MAVRGNKILAVGKGDELLRTNADDSTLKVDLKGKTVIPGVIETHSHFHSYARNHYRNSIPKLPEYAIDWARVKTKNDALAQIAAIMKENKFAPGEFVFFVSRALMGSEGAGDNRRSSKDRGAVDIFYEQLNMKDLDTVTPNNPIAITIGSGLRMFNGVAMINTQTWNLLNNKYGDFFMKYGRYWKDSSGNPNGIIEPPISLLIEHEMLPRSKAADLAPILKKELEEWSAMGVTAISSRIGSQDAEALVMLDRKNELKVRIPYGMSDFFAIPNPDGFFVRLGNLVNLGSSKVWINSQTPIIVDGQEARTATDQKRLNIYEPDDKWFPHGQLYLDPEYRGARGNYYKEWFLALGRSGGRLANMHTAGDRAVRQMVEIMEDVDKVYPIKDKEWALDHCIMVDPNIFERAAKVGVFFSCAAGFINRSADVEYIYGENVANNMVVPVKSMLNKGLKVVYQTDAHRYLWDDLELMITRNVNGKVWGPNERIDKVTALKMITSWAADYIDRDKELGTLEPGKWADVVVLDRDYLNIPDEDVSEVQALMTIFDGEIVHLHPQFSQEYNLKPPGAIIATFKDLFARR